MGSCYSKNNIIEPEPVIKEETKTNEIEVVERTLVIMPKYFLPYN